MKKFIAILLSMLLLCAMVPFATVAAADEPTAVAVVMNEDEEEVDTVNAGDTFLVQVNLLNNPGVIAVGVEVVYDHDVFEVAAPYDADEEMYVPAIEIGTTYKAQSNKWITFGPVDEENEVMQKCNVFYARGTASSNCTNEWFYTATFKVKDNAVSGDYTLNVNFTPKSGANIDKQLVDFASSTTTITVVGSEPSCEHEYDNACDVDCNLCGETREVEHNVVAVEAKDATCTELGNIAYWYCDVCGQAWLDEACTQNTNLMAVKLPMVDHEYFYACDPVCMNCYEITNPDAAHSLSHVEAKDATCFENGNVEYWTCEYCGGCWDNEAATGMPLNHMMVVVPMAHDELTHVEAKAPTCFENGNIEYWYCEACGMAWLDAEGTLNTNLMAVVLPMAHNELTHVEAVAPTCFENGNIEYWYCEACGMAWLDAEGTLNTNLMAVVLPMAHNELTHVEAKAPTCYENGNIEYWYCEACGYAWLDAEGTLNTNLMAVILPMAHGTITHVEAKDATCTELGNIEYWYCEACGQAWLDEACTLNTNLMAVKLPMAEHEYFYACDPVCMNCYEITNPDAAHSLSHVEAVAATCYENGNIEYWTCEYCGGCWDNEAATGMPLNRMMVIVPAAHAEATHVEAKAPTCFENGNIEYWYCEACGQAWLDAECTLNTNLRAVILPMAHNELTHVEAVAPTCYENGNIEYWYCEACGMAWLDAEGTLNTNLMAVVLPMAHGEITHVEAKDATCTELGNIEFWYCEACGQAWLDEACTLNTNMMAVKLPMVDHTYDNAHDADCNVCGEIREIVLGADEIILFGGNSVTEIKGGLAFLFNAAVDGIVYDEEYYADYTDAIVTIDGVEYKLIGMGAIMNNKGESNLSLDDVDNARVLNIKADKVFGDYSYAVRIVNIPEAHLDTEIIARPYFVYENLGGEQITVYGADQIASYNGVLNG